MKKKELKIFKIIILREGGGEEQNKSRIKVTFIINCRRKKL